MMNLHKLRILVSSLLVLFVLVLGHAGIASAELNQNEMNKLLMELDQRQRSLGDYTAMLYMEQKEKGKSDLVYQGVAYRRDTENKFIFLFLKPKTEAGKGYLRIDKNLFLFDPTVGKWERRTERERIGGTDSRRQDFDAKDLHKDYDPSYVGEEKLGKFTVHRLKLEAKEGAATAFPIMELWLDKETNNILKQQDSSASGKVLRTLYYPKWEKVPRANNAGSVYFPREIRIYDELNKGNETIIVIQKVELDDLPDNVFTKAWIESKSR